MDTENLEKLVESVRAGKRNVVRGVLEAHHPADLASLVSHLDAADAGQMLEWLAPERAAAVIRELDDELRTRLLEHLPLDRATQIVDALEADDAADLLALLPEAIVRRVLPRLQAAHAVESLLGYGTETAGGLMTPVCLRVLATSTVADATEQVRRDPHAVEHVYAVFVIDAAGRLVGRLGLDGLLLSPALAQVAEVMESDVVSVPTDMDQEEAARIIERYDLVSLPVVDGAGRLAGCITVDDAMDVLRDEAEEDMQRLSGSAVGEEATDSVPRIVRGRLPWLLGGLCGAGLAGFVVGLFEETLERAVILAGFIPVVMATAGNAGIQSSAVAVQGLATGDVWASDLGRRLGKELLVALLNGLAAALALGAFIVSTGDWLGVEQPLRLAATASIALLVVIVLASTIGATIPLMLHRLKIDPALAMGPFITTSNDILGVAIFFFAATQVYLN